MIGRHRWGVLVLAATVAGAGGFAIAAPAPGPEVAVYKSPNCGCCKKWVEHVQAAGFRVAVHDTSNLAGVMQRFGVPRKLTACHTAVVDGYVIEGHVPADSPPLARSATIVFRPVCGLCWSYMTRLLKTPCAGPSPAMVDSS